MNEWGPMGPGPGPKKSAPAVRPCAPLNCIESSIKPDRATDIEFYYNLIDFP